jgi:AcrR family transcriptional regulator
MGLREEKELLTRSEIMDAAFHLFCAQGIEPTEMMQIAKKARVSRPTLYRYFDTKERLAEAVYLRNLENTMIANTEISEYLPTFEIIRFFLDSVLAELKDNPKRLVYDAMYNLYASRLHIDPTTNSTHPLHNSRFRKVIDSDNFINPDETVRFAGDGDALMHAVLYPFFTYIQRLAIFSFQKDDNAWEETLHEANVLREFYLSALSPEPRDSGE